MPLSCSFPTAEMPMCVRQFIPALGKVGSAMDDPAGYPSVELLFATLSPTWIDES
jgi:hypothetical protein